MGVFVDKNYLYVEQELINQPIWASALLSGLDFGVINLMDQIIVVWIAFGKNKKLCILHVKIKLI